MEKCVQGNLKLYRLHWTTAPGTSRVHQLTVRRLHRHRLLLSYIHEVSSFIIILQLLASAGLLGPSHCLGLYFFTAIGLTTRITLIQVWYFVY